MRLCFRLEESRSSQQLQKALLKTEQLEHRLAAMQEGKVGIGGLVCDEMALPPDLPLSSAEIISKLNMHLLHVLDVSIPFSEEHNFWKLYVSFFFDDIKRLLSSGNITGCCSIKNCYHVSTF
jgi:hypothetical protein